MSQVPSTVRAYYRSLVMQLVYAAIVTEWWWIISIETSLVCACSQGSWGLDFVLADFR
jgi:hypothetical protein